MTLQRTRTAVARLGAFGAALVVGGFGVGLAALLVIVAPRTTNVGVFLAFLAGLAAGNVVWSWITATPASWRQPAQARPRWRVAAAFLVAFFAGYLVDVVLGGVIESILPTRRVVEVGPNGGVFYQDIPGNVVIWLTAIWLVVLVLELISTLAWRVFREFAPGPDPNAA